ncbi:MAG: 2-dehydro-3-deoxyphosphogluconate aldolase [Planctomycetota bacterium]|nr:MAG: 2-dehydro-3-deoxyphosphogluconate aldolase [Planctomycetota bacterium]
MNHRTPLDRVLQSGIVAVIRSSDGAVLGVAEALVAGGVDVVEITFTVPRADVVVARLAEQMGDRALVGAGTVLDAETARIAILAGAKFVVTPVVSLGVIELCRRYGVPVFCGAFTPTEVLTAWQAGADIVKVFPAEIGGPAHLKALRGPLPQIRLMPTGGVNLQTAAEFLRAGACALGVGGALVDERTIAAREFERITSLARQFTEIVQTFRFAKPT